MRNTILALMLIFTPLVWSYELPSHWSAPLTTEQMEMLKQKQVVVDEVKESIALKVESYFYDALSQLYRIGQKDPCKTTLTSQFANDLQLLGIIEVLGLISQNRDEDFDFSRKISIKRNTPFLIREDGRRYRPESPDEIEDPEVRADYIERAKAMKAYVKQYRLEYRLKSAWDRWFHDFHAIVYQRAANKTSNAVDRNKLTVIYELIRTANITEQSKQKLRFWLTMMVECDKSLVKKAREENDQTCANYVKELYGDSSVGDSSIGNAQRHKRS